MKYQLKDVEFMDMQSIELPDGSIVLDFTDIAKYDGPRVDDRSRLQKVCDALRGRGFHPSYDHISYGLRIVYLELTNEVEDEARGSTKSS